MFIEITIPVLNEEETLVKNILKIKSYIQEHLNEHHIVIVIADNGSTDKTEELGKDLASKNSEVRFLKVSRRGVGLALRESWSQSDADIVGYFDLDLATDLGHLDDVVKAFMDGADVVNGSRLLKKSQVIGRKLVREFTSRCFNFLIKLLFQPGITDGMCGFKFLKRSVFLNAKQYGLKNDGWFFSTELLVWASLLQFKIKEIPVHWTDDQSSKVKILKLSLEYLKEMMSLKRKVTQMKYRIHG